MDPQYVPGDIEARAQQYWQQNDSSAVSADPSREKYYCLSMFPYPSGKVGDATQGGPAV